MDKITRCIMSGAGYGTAQQAPSSGEVVLSAPEATGVTQNYNLDVQVGAGYVFACFKSTIIHVDRNLDKLANYSSSASSNSYAIVTAAPTDANNPLDYVAVGLATVYRFYPSGTPSSTKNVLPNIPGVVNGVFGLRPKATHFQRGTNGTINKIFNISTYDTTFCYTMINILTNTITSRGYVSGSSYMATPCIGGEVSAAVVIAVGHAINSTPSFGPLTMTPSDLTYVANRTTLGTAPYPIYDITWNNTSLKGACVGKDISGKNIIQYFLSSSFGASTHKIIRTIKYATDFASTNTGTTNSAARCAVDDSGNLYLLLQDSDRLLLYKLAANTCALERVRSISIATAGYKPGTGVIDTRRSLNIIGDDLYVGFSVVTTAGTTVSNCLLRLKTSDSGSKTGLISANVNGSTVYLALAINDVTDETVSVSTGGIFNSSSMPSMTKNYNLSTTSSSGPSNMTAVSPEPTLSDLA